MHHRVLLFAKLRKYYIFNFFPWQLIYNFAAAQTIKKKYWNGFNNSREKGTIMLAVLLVITIVFEIA